MASFALPAKGRENLENGRLCVRYDASSFPYLEDWEREIGVRRVLLSV